MDKFCALEKKINKTRKRKNLMAMAGVCVPCIRLQIEDVTMRSNERGHKFSSPSYITGGSIKFTYHAYSAFLGLHTIRVQAFVEKHFCP